VDVTIYDNQGRPIRKLKDNYFIGQTGILTWDGINDDGNKAEIGTYVILISVINPQGDETVYKLVTVLAGQL
jgi:flagellar hook assembly protein FlgD